MIPGEQLSLNGHNVRPICAWNREPLLSSGEPEKELNFYVTSSRRQERTNIIKFLQKCILRFERIIGCLHDKSSFCLVSNSPNRQQFSFQFLHVMQSVNFPIFHEHPSGSQFPLAIELTCKLRRLKACSFALNRR